MRDLTLTLLLLGVLAGFPAAAPAATSVSRAADYLVARQTSDGCLGDRTGTGWGAIALRAANRRAAARRAATCIARQSAALRTATDRELGIMAAVAGGLNPRRFGGRDLVGAPRAQPARRLLRQRHRHQLVDLRRDRPEDGEAADPEGGRAPDPARPGRRAAASTTSPRGSRPT